MVKKDSPKYRFKIEEEMIKEFGEYWWQKLNWSKPNMDFILGKPFTEFDGDIDFERNNYVIGHFRIACGPSSWTIESNMLTYNKKIKPSYKPKKFIY